MTRVIPDLAPPVSQDAIAAHVLSSGVAVEPDAADREAIAAAPHTSAFCHALATLGPD